MTELLTAAQMKAIEQAAIESGEVTGLELMERAGRGVVEAIFEEWPELAKTSHRAVVLCGPGNNGGDGFVVARLLKEWGWEVEVFLYGDAEKLPTDAKVNYERWGEMGAVAPSKEFDPFRIKGDVLIDALFGTGLTRTLEGEASRLANGASHERTVAVDAPSGLGLDNGKVLVNPLEDGPRAHLTITFHAAKVGHFVGDGPARCGHLKTVDIGLPYRRSMLVLGALSDVPSGVRRDPSAVASLLDAEPYQSTSYNQSEPPLQKIASGHKYTHGHALILSGGVGKGGAARLAARGALRIGAGLVSVGCPPGALQENAGALDAVMARSVKGGEGLAETLQDERINALCLGPGLGLEERAVGLLTEVLEIDVQRAATDPRAESEAPARGGGSGAARPAAERSLVLDADALTILSREPDLFAGLHENCVLTPHAGEFTRLFPDIAKKLNAPATKGPAYSKVDATREAAARAGCVVLFKGADTVIAAPDGRCSINSAHYERSAAWLATPGSGDVLAGFITGLLARGFAPMQAAETGAWLHVECALKFGPGLIAEDLPEQLPAVFRDLGI